jgi:hypothetical protein
VSEVSLSTAINLKLKIYIITTNDMVSGLEQTHKGGQGGDTRRKDLTIFAEF